MICTRDRRERLLATLGRLQALDGSPPIVVVDNASDDGTAAAVRRRYPDATLIEARRPLGSAARTVGVEAAGTPLVAFNDDDSWWAPGALERAANVFDAYPRLGLLAARIVVEPGGRLDTTSRLMRESPLVPLQALPGPPVLGFLACGAVARRAAVLACGGFHPRYGFGGEEHLLAVDMAAAGWGLAYVDDVAAHHAPAAGPRDGRRLQELRNRLWSTWLRRPLPRALRMTLALAADKRSGPRALLAAMRGLPWVLRERRVLPAHLERSLRLLEETA